MLDTLLTLINFVLVLGLLIAVHEFGHFWVARRLGVKVLRFSIGFGKPIWRRVGKIDSTEYMISAIPLGGYVKMLDEREGEVSEEEKGRAFNRQSLGVRAAIVAAGPIFNLLLAIIAYWLMFMNGVPGVKPIIGEVNSSGIAIESGFRPNDHFMAVNGRETPTWQAVIEEVLPRLVVGDEIQIEVERQKKQEMLMIRHTIDETLLKEHSFFSIFGIEPYRLAIEPIIDQVIADSAAAAAGLQKNDLIIAINGKSIREWGELVAIVRDSADTPLLFEIERVSLPIELTVRPHRIVSENGSVGRIGVSVYSDPERLKEMQIFWQLSPLDALSAALTKCVDISRLTLKMIGQMITGAVSTDNISGPISIAQYAKSASDAGLSQLLGFVAIISLSLAILNLLPIPVLDGGHLLYFLVEWIKGSPLSEQAMILGQQIGIFALSLLMMIAFYNDFSRLGWW